MKKNSNRLLLLVWCLKANIHIFFFTLIVVIIFTIIDLSYPKIMQLFIDSIAGKPISVFTIPLRFLQTNMGRLVYIPLSLIIISLLKWLFTFLRTVLQTRLGQQALFQLRNRIFNTMQNLSFAYHDQNYSGTLISNVVEEIVNFDTESLLKQSNVTQTSCVYF